MWGFRGTRDVGIFLVLVLGLGDWGVGNLASML